MAETERIQLVLDVSGVQDVAQLKAEMENLAQALGVADYRFEQTGQAAEKAAAGIDDMNDAAAQAAGGPAGSGPTRGRSGQGGRGGKSAGGFNGQGLLSLAYFLDDMQYGMRGIMNNIPQVVGQLGLGAGLAGVAGIAAVAVGQLVERHPEWFDWSEKVRDKLKELVDVIEDEAEAVKKQREQVEKMGEAESARTEELIRLKQATDELKAAESGLAADREARKAADDAAKNKGTADAEELAKSRQVFTDYAVDPGNAEAVMAEMRKRIQADPNLRGAASEAAGIDPVSGVDDDDLLAEIVAENQAFGSMTTAEAKNLFRANPRLKAQAKARYGQQIETRRQFRLQQYDENLVGNIFGRLARTAQTGEDFGQAFRAFGAIMPAQAAMLNRERAERAGDEEFERGNQRWQQGGRVVRRRREADEARDQAEQDRLDDVVNDFARAMNRDAESKRRQAEREASARESTVNRAIMNPEQWQGRFIQARNAAIQQGRNPAQVNALAERNNAAIMNEMREGFEKAGFTQEQAAAASRQVSASVMQSIQRMVQTGQASLDAYGRIQVTVQNLERQIDAQAAEWAKASWQGGFRDR